MRPILRTMLLVDRALIALRNGPAFRRPLWEELACVLLGLVLGVLLLGSGLLK